MYTIKTLQSAAGATGNGTAVECKIAGKRSWRNLTLQVTGITSATITWEATIDGTNWVATGVLSLADLSTVATTTTANGLFRVPVEGFTQFRARISTYATGTITVTGVLTAE